jgi:hypothetical protein
LNQNNPLIIDLNDDDKGKAMVESSSVKRSNQVAMLQVENRKSKADTKKFSK